MSQDTNVTIVQRFYEKRDDPTRVRLLFDPDVIVHNLPNAVDTAPYVGYAGLRKWDEDVRDGMGDYRLVAEEVIDVGENRVIAVGRVCGKGPRSGIAVEVRSSTVLTLRSGKIVEARAYETKSEALKAVGLEG